MKNILKIISISLIILSYCLLGFTLFAWISEFQFRQSELLPILMASSVNLLLFIFYKILNNNMDFKESKLKKYISLVGFYGNFFFIGMCVIVIFALCLGFV